MFSAAVAHISITVLIGITFADEEAKATIKYLEPDKGTEGYDLFYYDGESLRDEKWRFDPKTGSTVVSRRNGFREMDNFHLVDATLDALGSFTKSYKMKNEKDLLKHRVDEPHVSKEIDDGMKAAVKASNAFSGVSINTQYSTQNGYPHVSNVVGIQQSNVPNTFNGINFQQAFATSGFGFQQQGSLFNHQAPFPNNHNFQMSSLFMPFFNQHINNPNQHHTLGSYSTFGALSHTQVPFTEQQHTITTTTQTTPDTPKVSESPSPQSSTLEPIVNVETTEDPTLSFDVRLEQDKNNETSDSETQNIQTTTRRAIEGLPTSDEEENEGGVLDDKINPDDQSINPQVLKTLVG